MGRVRGRGIETDTVNARIVAPAAVVQGAVADGAVYGPELRPGLVGSSHLGRQAVREQHVDPALIPRETVHFEQVDDAVVENQSRNVPVRIGGQPRIVAQVSANFTTAGELTLYRNGTSVGTFTLATGQAQHESGLFRVSYSPLDTVAVEVSDAGEGGEGLVVEVWFA